MKKLILSLCFFSTSVFAQLLPSDAPERQQLLAMGAEILPDNTSKTYTHFKLGGDRFFISKSPERIELGRAFIRTKKLDEAQNFELHKLINKFNVDQSFQFVIFEESIQANIYMYGSYDPRVLARLILGASKIGNIFEANPRIYDLVNQ
jgi:hypothetical protein